MFTRKLETSAVLIAFVLVAGAALAEGPRLGKPIDAADMAAWDISIQPDGSGLPPGSGTPAEGAKISLAGVRSATARTARVRQLVQRRWSEAAR